MTPVEIVEAFIGKWNDNDIEGAFAMMSEDAIWHNIPMEPAVGIDAMRALMDGFPPVEGIDFESHFIAANGNVVMTERTDKFILEGGKQASIRLMGIFEIGDDGKITKWRDYFDMMEFQREFAG